MDSNIKQLKQKYITKNFKYYDNDCQHEMLKIPILPFNEKVLLEFLKYDNQQIKKNHQDLSIRHISADDIAYKEHLNDNNFFLNLLSFRYLSIYLKLFKEYGTYIKKWYFYIHGVNNEYFVNIKPKNFFVFYNDLKLKFTNPNIPQSEYRYSSLFFGPTVSIFKYISLIYQNHYKINYNHTPWDMFYTHNDINKPLIIKINAHETFDINNVVRFTHMFFIKVLEPNVCVNTEIKIKDQQPNQKTENQGLIKKQEFDYFGFKIFVNPLYISTLELCREIKIKISMVLNDLQNYNHIDISDYDYGYFNPYHFLQMKYTFKDYAEDMYKTIDLLDDSILNLVGINKTDFRKKRVDKPYIKNTTYKRYYKYIDSLIDKIVIFVVND